MSGKSLTGFLTEAIMKKIEKYWLKLTFPDLKW